MIMLSPKTAQGDPPAGPIGDEWEEMFGTDEPPAWQEPRELPEQDEELEVAPSGREAPEAVRPPGGEQPEPYREFAEAPPPPTPPDPNEGFDIRGRIWKAMSGDGPLGIVYNSLAGLTTERTVHPDYVYWAGTRRHVMVAWDDLRNDWRAFIVDRIMDARLEANQ
jgi:hypothetical protein